MRHLKYLPSVLCMLLLQGAITVTYAADANKAQRELLEEVPPPPKVIEGEPMEEPQVTIRKKAQKPLKSTVSMANFI